MTAYIDPESNLICFALPNGAVFRLIERETGRTAAFGTFLGSYYCWQLFDRHVFRGFAMSKREAKDWCLKGIDATH